MFPFTETHFEQKEQVITHAVELLRSNKARSCRLWLKEAEEEWYIPREEKTCGRGPWVAAWTGKARLTGWARAGGSVPACTGGWRCGNETDGAEANCVKTGGVENPGPDKVVAGVDVGVERTLAADRTSGKSEGEQQAGTEDEKMSKRATSWLGAGNAWLTFADLLAAAMGWWNPGQKHKSCISAWRATVKATESNIKLQKIYITKRLQLFIQQREWRRRSAVVRRLRISSSQPPQVRGDWSLVLWFGDAVDANIHQIDENLRVLRVVGT